jgi:hypothetical protein
MFNRKKYCWLVVWINQKRSIPKVLHVFVASTYCETIIHIKRKVVELIVMTEE